MAHSFLISAAADLLAAGFILRGVKGVFVAVGSIVAAILCAVIAAAKRRSALGWGIAGLFFSILTLIVVIIVPSKKD